MRLAAIMTTHVMAGLSAIAVYFLVCQTFEVAQPLCKIDYPTYEIAANAPIDPRPGPKRKQ